ncbi:RNA polymerase sigma factor [Pedobacter sp. Leaf250]|uniref:RNA polymerase sigma factor n=1 Tax=Pedobacter sp. Leaf250 TaxID=2876559 RepID=UPI001E2D3442|nr:sigma-70 family RNA polymerase sigma factor [Pedobacter sp. Leaf250]
MHIHTKPVIDEYKLLRQVAQGSQHAFKLLYELHKKKVFNKAFYILKSEVLAEEVLQEVMLKFWQNAGSMRPDSNISAYLLILAQNQSFQILRRKVLEARTEVAMGEAWTEKHNETEEEILLADTRKILTEGIALLPAQQKMVYELCHIQGLKYEQAAQQMNLSVETVRSYMKLALRFLRAYLKTHTDIVALLVIFRLI